MITIKQWSEFKEHIVQCQKKLYSSKEWKESIEATKEHDRNLESRVVRHWWGDETVYPHPLRYITPDNGDFLRIIAEIKHPVPEETIEDCLNYLLSKRKKSKHKEK